VNSGGPITSRIQLYLSLSLSLLIILFFLSALLPFFEHLWLSFLVNKQTKKELFVCNGNGQNSPFRVGGRPRVKSGWKGEGWPAPELDSRIRVLAEPTPFPGGILSLKFSEARRRARARPGVRHEPPARVLLLRSAASSCPSACAGKVSTTGAGTRPTAGRRRFKS
jgi:hypothetical protein